MSCVCTCVSKSYSKYIIGFVADYARTQILILRPEMAAGTNVSGLRGTRRLVDDDGSSGVQRSRRGKCLRVVSKSSVLLWWGAAEHVRAVEKVAGGFGDLEDKIVSGLAVFFF